ncbi:short chain dehydrogenase reductase family [Fusarium albosuccineum]|uniref:Short chain dehydrogenase reductase family n=1 Tax=Fusarium albosuccineum TaxID=1237068 RepID=A0A8H4L1R2_9HYPO|nr:short chain dehydrogenase reductase family [Fusarium albosuccineum]
MERADLTSRIIPLMSLSAANAPLTQPVPVLQDLSPTARAQLRFQIEGNAIVTGGAGDLGFAAGRALLEHGLRGLMIWDIDPPSALAKVESLQIEFPTRRINFLRVDVTNAEEVQKAVAATVEILGSVDILLTFAGVASCDDASTVSAEEWRRVFEINTTGAFLCSQAVANAVAVAGKGGSIVHVASISAHRVNYPQPQAAYNASKAAVLAMTKSLAAEWAAYGVRVNSIRPGYMDTILNDGAGLEVARNIWIERNPMGRMGYPEELCGAVVLMASRAGRYITGADIVIDSGQTLF